MVAAPVPIPDPSVRPDAHGLELVHESSRRVLPPLRQIFRRMLPQAVEASIVPAVIVLALTNFATPTIAIAVAFGWALVTATWRFATRRRISGLSILAIVRLFVRSLIAIAAGSTFVYFLQGSIGGYAFAAAFLVSVLIDRPLARRFADDFTDLPARILEHQRVRRVLRRISLLWGIIGFTHASVGLWLLMNLSTNVYVIVNALLSVAVPATLIAISVRWFRRTVVPVSLAST
jgi:hypothetical protein